MRAITILVPDDTDEDQVAAVIEAAQAGSFIAIRRPPELTPMQVGSFCVQAKLVLDGMVAENAVLVN